MKRRTKITVVLLVFSVLACVVPIGGRPLIGFDYRAVDDTEFTVCTDWVVGQSGDVITLATGEKFRVRGFEPAALTDLLLQSNALVKVDRVAKRFSIRRQGAACGMRPEMEQWITIPLRATERVQTYHAIEVGEVDAIPAAGG